VRRPPTITVVSVVPEKDARASKSGGHLWLAPHAHLDVAKAHGFLREAGIDAEMKILHGDPVEELCKEAANGYDLALVGSRELGLLGELLLGSVSRRLLAEMPVLVVGRACLCTTSRLRKSPAFRRCRRPAA
jgi:nucleotide-binding universal stress UspA family protein